MENYRKSLIRLLGEQTIVVFRESAKGMSCRCQGNLEEQPYTTTNGGTFVTACWLSLYAWAAACR
eukprot:scaffold2344_cov394-Pavlova_lutheri.AAC.2